MLRYTHIEAECPFITFEDLLNRLEDLVCDVVDRVLKSPAAELLYDINPVRDEQFVDKTDSFLLLRHFSNYSGAFDLITFMCGNKVDNLFVDDGYFRTSNPRRGRSRG